MEREIDEKIHRFNFRYIVIDNIVCMDDIV